MVVSTVALRKIRGDDGLFVSCFDTELKDMVSTAGSADTPRMCRGRELLRDILEIGSSREVGREDSR